MVSVATPVVLVLHGGNGNSNSGIDMSCASGQRSDSSCWHSVAERYGFVLAIPNGTRTSSGSAQRQWNAGGGTSGWQCVGAQACVSAVDDVAYIRAVLSDLERWMHIDRRAVFATGLSNGAALAHRLACEMADALTAIAPVGGGNQFEATRACAPTRPVAVLGIHGTADPCWTYDESSTTCLGAVVGRKVGIRETMANWAQRHRCSASRERSEFDRDGDGIFSVETQWDGCAAPVRLLEIRGGGHTYPDGRQYLPADSIGPTARDWGADRVFGFFASVAGLQDRLTGLWYVPGQDGWGLSITRQGEVLFPAWFTYSESGRPIWFLVPGATRQADGSYAGQLLRFTGTPLANIAAAPASRGSTVVGDARFFAPAEGELSFSYRIGGVEQTRSMRRLSPGPEPICLMGQGSASGSRNTSDYWWTPSEPGWGLHLSESDGRIFLSWYSYASDGEPLWIVGLLTRSQQGSYRGSLQRAQRGTPFAAITGPATTFPLPDVGEAELRFDDGARGQFAYTVDGSSRTTRIERFVFAGPTQSTCI
jgi:polyhydroxybutyrate depolymerase